MTIDLKWLMPVVSPVATVLFVRFLAWLAGAGWAIEGAVAATALGVVSGVAALIAVIGMNEEGVYWRVRIGKGDQDA